MNWAEVTVEWDSEAPLLLFVLLTTEHRLCDSLSGGLRIPGGFGPSRIFSISVKLQGRATVSLFDQDSRPTEMRPHVTVPRMYNSLDIYRAVTTTTV